MAILRILCVSFLAISAICKGLEIIEAPPDESVAVEDEELFFLDDEFLRQVGLNSSYGDQNTTQPLADEQCVRAPENMACPDERVSFFLYAGANGERKYINESDPNWFANSKFDKSKKTVMLIHGFGGGDDIGSMPLLRDAYIKTKLYNVINADWEVLARWPCYLQAIGNLKPVAKCTAHFLVNLEKISMVQYEKITCVGFSLGAHVCGLVSNYVSDKIEKIIALDPAKPLIQSKNKKDRLDAADATHVQIIHSNAGYFGMSGLHGTVDFCMNGGRVQTYCKSTPDDNYCSHLHALCFLAESLFPAKSRQGVPCDNRCPHGKFKPKTGSNATVGQYVESSAKGMYCVTAPTPPYCQDENSADPEYGDPKCCPLTGLVI